MKVTPGGSLTLSAVVRATSDSATVAITTSDQARHEHTLTAGVGLALDVQHVRKIEVLAGDVAFTTRKSGLWSDTIMVEGDNLEMEPVNTPAPVSPFHKRMH